MSKLYDSYLLLKSNEKNPDNTLFLFKSGIFFVFIDADAIIASSLLNLKLTCLTEKIVKCGFPISSLEKYKNILNKTAYSIKIIDNTMNISYSINNYELDNTIYILLSKIKNIDTNLLSIKEAYQFINDIKLEANFILEKNKKDS